MTKQRLTPARCACCGEAKSPDMFALNRTRNDGLNAYCVACYSDKKREARREGMLVKYAPHPAKQAASALVNALIKRGILVRPDACDVCGRGSMPHAHHTSYHYTKWADVVWVCRRCHARLHQKPLPGDSAMDRGESFDWSELGLKAR